MPRAAKYRRVQFQFDERSAEPVKKLQEQGRMLPEGEIAREITKSPAASPEGAFPAEKPPLPKIKLEPLNKWLCGCGQPAEYVVYLRTPRGDGYLREGLYCAPCGQQRQAHEEARDHA